MPSKLGILAGGGELPARLIAACKDAGRQYFVVAFKDHTDPDLILGEPQAWIRLGETGTGFDLLKREGVEEVVLAGPVTRPSLRELRPDWRTAKFLARIGVSALGDDGLLRAVIREIEEEGFRVVGADDVLGDLLAWSGAYGAFAPDEQAEIDIQRGIEVARGLGGLDVGQGVVVQQGIVLAVEAVEGTDAMLGRCATLRRPGPGGVLVKLCKPGQDRRADLPTIGPATIRNAAQAGLRGVAIQAGHTLVLNQKAIIADADSLGLFVCGLDLGEI